MVSGLDVLAGRARWAIDRGDVLERLAALPDESVNCVVTSPPYWGLRDYGTASWEGGDPDCDHKGPPMQSRRSTLAGNGHGGDKPLSPSLQAQAQPFRTTCAKCGATRVDRQIGLEPTPDAYVARMVAVFAEVRRVLRLDGTCWVNLGDSYAAGGNGARDPERWPKQSRNADGFRSTHSKKASGVKPKDLVGIPWRVAFALQADGWWLRSDVVWAKPNPMPESVTDRPTRSHEYLFLLTKSAKYAYDADAIREPLETAPHAPGNMAADRWREVRGASVSKGMSGHLAEPDRTWGTTAGRNKRTVWTIATEPYPDAHFATFPTALVEPCVLAGCPVGGVVLDPFCGSGTTLLVALRHGRRGVGIELNPTYVEMASRRVFLDCPMFNAPAEEVPA